MAQELTFDEGDDALLKVHVARANGEQALIEFKSMEGPYSIRVPLSEFEATELLKERQRAEAAEQREHRYIVDAERAQARVVELEAALLAWLEARRFWDRPEDVEAAIRALVFDPTALDRKQGSWVCGRCGAAPEAHAGESSTCVYDPIFVDALERHTQKAVEATLAAARDAAKAGA